MNKRRSGLVTQNSKQAQTDKILLYILFADLKS